MSNDVNVATPSIAEDIHPVVFEQQTPHTQQWKVKQQWSNMRIVIQEIHIGFIINSFTHKWFYNTVYFVK